MRRAWSRRCAAAVACGLVLALSVPAVALDDDLMNPNDCDFGSGRVPSGTVIPVPPGVPQTPDGGTSTQPTTVINGVPQSNLYMCIGGRWVWVGTALEIGPVLPDATSVEVAEGSQATMDGIVTAGETGPATDLTASWGTVTLYPGGAWRWTGTPDDGPAVVPVVIGATVDGVARSSGFVVEVTNVAPTVTSLAPDDAVALVGEPVSFSGTASDPSAADTAAGFTWDLGTTTFDTCGSHTAEGTATDKDGGASDPFTSEPVAVVEARFGAPLVEGARNLVRAGQVVPVRVIVGCGGAAVDGLAPTIRLLAGDVDPATLPDDPAIVVPAADAPGENSGVMGPVGDAYLYNLRVPAAPSGSLFTVRVRPDGDGGAVSVVLQIR